MNKILTCRRTFICVLAIGCLTALGLIKGTDVAMALASVAIGLAGSNAYESAMRGRGPAIITATDARASMETRYGPGSAK